LAETSNAEQEQPFNLLVRLSGWLSPEIEAAIHDLGGQVRTEAGDILSISLPLSHVNDLAGLDTVVYIEAAQPLYPETSE